MQRKLLVVLLSFVFVLGFSVDAEAQRSKKKKGKQRPAKTEQSDETISGSERSSRSSGSERSSRVSGEEDKGFSTDKLVYDIMGDFRIPFRTNNTTVLKFGLKPAVSYKVLPRLSFGLAPKIEYYFFSNVNDEDGHEFDLGIEAFGRFLVFETIYLQLGYDFNNSTFLFPDRREWLNSPVVGGGYMSGFGQWKYGAQALLVLSEERADQYGLLELWFGLTYNF